MFYGEDLAYIQTEAYGGFAEKVAPVLRIMLREAGITRTNKDRAKVVDVGCGDGRWLKALTDAGYDALGVDSSKTLVTIARRTAPLAKVVRASIADFKLPPCDAVTALGEVLAYLPPKGKGPALATTFKRIARALAPGGLFIFDLIVEGKPMSYRRKRKGKDWALTTKVQEEDAVLTREIASQRQVDGDRWRESFETHRLRIYPRADVVAALRAAGFTVRTAPAYGRHKLLPRRLAFFARLAK